MKSAYELAMERLEKSAPTQKISDEQKRAIAEIDSQFKAKTAERELFLTGQIKAARQSGQYGEAESIEKQLAMEVRRLKEDCEERKEQIRKQNP